MDSLICTSRTSQTLTLTYNFILKLEGKNSREVERENSMGVRSKVYSNAAKLADVYMDIGLLIFRPEE